MIDATIKILFLTPDLEDNSLGRTYALWLLAQHLGLESIVISTRGDGLWGPLATDSFANICHKIEDVNQIISIAKDFDVILTVQPLKESFNLGRYIASKVSKPMVADIDDPDLVTVLAPNRVVKAAAKWFLKTPKMINAYRQLKLARKFPTIVSNPVLQKYHGGTIISHARLPLEAGAPHLTRDPHVVFVGTNRQHKGVNLLRLAINELQSVAKFRLTVTDVAPSDAKSWENWVGQLPFREAMALVRSADIVALPSLEISYGQFPAKLVDAMLAGRAVLASGVEPIPWALNGSGLIVETNSVHAIKNGLQQLRDPRMRELLGQNARTYALENYTVSPNAIKFYTVLRNAIDSYY